MNNIFHYKNMIYIIRKMYLNKLVYEYEIESGDVTNSQYTVQQQFHLMDIRYQSGSRQQILTTVLKTTSTQYALYAFILAVVHDN